MLSLINQRVSVLSGWACDGHRCSIATTNQSSMASSNEKTGDQLSILPFVTAGKQVSLGDFSETERKVLKRLISGEHELGLVNNIIYNPAAQATGCTHIELTEDTLRIEYMDGTSPDYRRHASYISMTPEEREQAGIPEHLVPIKVENLSNWGAGATIHLDRKRVSKKLKEMLASANSAKNAKQLPPSR